MPGLKYDINSCYFDFRSSFNHSMVLSDGLWHFVNVSLGNSKFEMFVDGVLVFSEVIAMMTENWVPDELNVTLGGSYIINHWL